MKSIFNFKNVISFVAIALMLLAGCTFYDNYDITLMPATANNDDDAKSSSSKGKDTLVVIIGGSSSSSVMERYSSSAWPCGDSTLNRGDVEYETVDINGLCITKKNLSYVPKSGKTICYENDKYPDKEANCEKFGALYNYEAAEKVCPKGWRLLSDDDVRMMILYAAQYGETDEAGQHFKAKGEWPDDEDALPATDKIGFTGLPGGVADEDGECSMLYESAQWWTSHEVTKDLDHEVLAIKGDDDGASLQKIDNKEYASVRCVKE